MHGNWVYRTPTLAETVDQYNSLESGVARPIRWANPSEYLATLGSGPWYALDCRTAGAVRNPSITLGGLCVDENSGEVLAEDGRTIKGLYAAGRSAVGIASHSYVSGLSIAGCIFSGGAPAATPAGIIISRFAGNPGRRG